MNWLSRRGRAQADGAGTSTGHTAQEEDQLRLARAAATNMLEAVALIRAADGVFVYTNPSWDELFGYEPGELPGNHVSVVNTPTDQTPEERASEIIDALRGQGSWRGMVHNVAKDGEHFWCEAAVSEFDHPVHGTVWIAVHRETTQQLAAAADLRATSERYRSAFERSPTAMMLLTEDLRMADVNRAFCSMLGYSSEELVGKPLADVTHPDDIALDPAFFAGVFGPVDRPSSAERRYVTSRSAGLSVTIDAVAMAGVDGRASYAVATVSRRGQPSPPGSPAGPAAAP